jgi:hypothetical protein
VLPDEDSLRLHTHSGHGRSRHTHASPTALPAAHDPRPEVCSQARSQESPVSSQGRPRTSIPRDAELSSCATQRRSGCLVCMRVWAYTVGVVALLSAIASASPASASYTKISRCRHRGVLAEDAHAQVYRQRNEVFGCAYGRRRAYVLGPAFVPGPTPGKPANSAAEVTTVKALTGTTVAVEHHRTEQSNQLLVVMDLRSGRVIHRVHTGGPPNIGCDYDCDGSAVNLLLKEDGSLAWLTTGGVSVSDSTTELHAVDKTGSRILAAGSTLPFTTKEPIPPNGIESLVLAGSTLRWTQGGQPKSATLN